ncbi:MAG: hypothetical protein WC393_01935 [Candidatus Nanoarchaeia archaeon]|jgi:hypothetical protein
MEQKYILNVKSETPLTPFFFSGVKNMETEFLTAIMLQAVKNKGMNEFSRNELYTSKDEICTVLEQYLDKLPIDLSKTLGFTMAMVGGIGGMVYKAQKDNFIEFDEQAQSFMPTQVLIDKLVLKNYLINIE